jgi:hypothetical protein
MSTPQQEKPNPNDPLFFEVGSAMKSAGIVEFSLIRLDFIFKIKTLADSEITYSAFAEFLPDKSFSENRDSIVKRLKELQKEGTLLINTKEDFEDVKKEVGNVLSDNSDALMQRMSSANIGEHKKLEEVFAYKYSANFTSTLYETIILEDIPRFIGYNSEANTIEEKLYIIDEIDEVQRIIKPMPKEAHACRPYEFVNAQELFLYLKKAHFETIASLYTKSKNIVQKYVVQDIYIQQLLATNVVWSYFQDKMPTTTYLLATGDNNSGKTAAGYTYKGIGYRAVSMVNPTASNIYRTCGSIEAAQVTIVLDEAEKVSDNKDTTMADTLRSGYQRDEVLPRNDSSDTGYKTNYYFPYCFKFMISEKGLNEYDSKGVLDRTLSFNTKPGDPAYNIDIKEVLVYGRNTTSPYLQNCFNEIISFRKLMLLYRLVHFQDKIEDIDIGLTRRNKELAKPILMLFIETEVQAEVEETLKYFLEQKNERKQNTLEATLGPLVLSFFTDKSKKIINKPITEIWAKVVKELSTDATYNSALVKQIETFEFGTLYKGGVLGKLRDRFGGKTKKFNGVRNMVFNYDTVSAVAENYTTEIKIKCKRVSYPVPVPVQDTVDSVDSVPEETPSEKQNFKGEEQ